MTGDAPDLRDDHDDARHVAGYRADCAACQHNDRALAAPAPSSHQPDAPHEYEIKCKVCGQVGTLRVSVDPALS